MPSSARGGGWLAPSNALPSVSSTTGRTNALILIACVLSFVILSVIPGEQIPRYDYFFLSTFPQKKKK
jgi:hypothetical protein